MNSYWIYHYLDRYIGIPAGIFLGFLDSVFRGEKDTASGFRNILVIKLAMVGDTILLVPALRALRAKYPSGRITMLCSGVNKDIVEDWDFIDEHIVFDFAGCFRKPWKLAGFILSLRKKHFDATLDFETWPRVIPLIAYLTGAKTRVGFKVPGQARHFLFTRPVEHVRKKHELKCFIDIVNALGTEVKDTSLYLKIGDREKDYIDKLLEDNSIARADKFVIIHPGAGAHGYYRQWFEDRYAAIADHILDKGKLKVVLTGTKDDGDIVEKVASCMKKKPIVLAGKTTLKEYFALVKRASLVICANTGAMHIASALGTPLIVLQGPTDPDKWGPWGEKHIMIRKALDCSPCSYLGFEFDCKDRRCMDLITVEEVKQALDRMSLTLF